jgi:hypothetical protein
MNWAQKKKVDKMISDNTVQKKYFNPAVNEQVNVIDKGGTIKELGAAPPPWIHRRL